MNLKTSGISIIIIMAIVAVSACKKDEKVAVNSFKYNNKEARIGTVVAEIYGESPSDGVYGAYVYFLENTLILHMLDGYPDSISGKGDLLMLAMLTSDSTGIRAGEYVYSSSEDTYVANTFGYESGLAINIDSSLEEDPTLLELNGGKVSVKRNGDEYEFSFTITTKINSTITGYYKGKIATYNYSFGGKAARKNPFALPHAR